MSDIARQGRLARLLAASWQPGVDLDASDPEWAALDAEVAAAVAAEFYAQAGVSGDWTAWKMGAFDAHVQKRLGLSGPLVAPLLPGVARFGVRAEVLSLADFHAPKFEPEIGLVTAADGARAVPCVEISDCRFSGWTLPPFGAVADAGLQGRMLFGDPGCRPALDADSALWHVEITHDGRPVGSASAQAHDVLPRLQLLPQAADNTHSLHVATGGLTDLIVCLAGHWRFDFGALGSVDVDVQ